MQVREGLEEDGHRTAWTFIPGQLAVGLGSWVMAALGLWGGEGHSLKAVRGNQSYVPAPGRCAQGILKTLLYLVWLLHFFHSLPLPVLPRPIPSCYHLQTEPGSSVKAPYPFALVSLQVAGCKHMHAVSMVLTALIINLSLGLSQFLIHITPSWRFSAWPSTLIP